jgi:hypothetical protein
MLAFAAVAALAVGVSARAEELKSGLQAGAGIGPFNVTKVAGAEKDNVECGQNLCYRCKNGARPQVMVFTRSTDAKVVDLVRKLDAQLKKSSDKELRAFVNVLSDSKETATEECKKLATASKAEQVPFVVPNEFENGPEDYGINAKVAVTVIVANKAKVTASHSFASANDVNADKVIADVEKSLK